MQSMFYQAAAFNQVLCWNLQSLYYFSNIFRGKQGLIFSKTISRMSFVFSNCTADHFSYCTVKPLIQRKPTSKPAVMVTVRPTTNTITTHISNQTTYHSSHPLSARYIKLYRGFKSPLGDHYIHILGIDIYDTYGTFISDKSISSMSNIFQNDSSHYGPQFLIDGIHKEMKQDNSYRIPFTENDPFAYMQLDFGKDVNISSMVLWNLVNNDTSKRIVGCTLVITNDAGSIVFAHMFDILQDSYDWEFGPRHHRLFRSTIGPIRHYSGLCLSNENGLLLSNCESRSPKQQWVVRSISSTSDFSFQISNTGDSCIDIVRDQSYKKGGILVAGLQKCNVISMTQKWTYTGRNIFSKAYADVCLRANGDLASRVSLEACIYDPTTAWLEYSISPWSGNVLVKFVFVFSYCGVTPIIYTAVNLFYVIEIAYAAQTIRQ